MSPGPIDAQIWDTLGMHKTEYIWLLLVHSDGIIMHWNALYGSQPEWGLSQVWVKLEPDPTATIYALWQWMVLMMSTIKDLLLNFTCFQICFCFIGRNWPCNETIYCFLIQLVKVTYMLLQICFTMILKCCADTECTKLPSRKTSHCSNWIL